jgi:hypothetical protein
MDPYLLVVLGYQAYHHCLLILLDQVAHVDHLDQGYHEILEVPWVLLAQWVPKSLEDPFHLVHPYHLSFLGLLESHPGLVFLECLVGLEDLDIRGGQVLLEVQLRLLVLLVQALQQVLYFLSDLEVHHVL